MGPNFKRLKMLAKELDWEKLDELMNNMKSMLWDKWTVVEEAEKAVDDIKEPESKDAESQNDVDDETKETESKDTDGSVSSIIIEDWDPYIKNIWTPDLPDDVQWVKVSTITVSDDWWFDNLVWNVWTIWDNDDANKEWKDSKLSNNAWDDSKKTSWIWFFDWESITPEICTWIDSWLRNNSWVIAKIYWDWKTRYDDNNWKSIWDSLDWYVTKYVVIDNRIDYNNKALKQIANPSATWDDINVAMKIIDDNIYMQHLLDLALEQIISTEK